VDQRLGAFVFDVTAQVSTQVYTGGGRFIDLLVVPEPGSALLITSVTALVALTRRRNAR
jgi:hypothetical protein